MKIYCAGLITETNSFSPIPTGYADFMVTRPGGPRGDFAIHDELIAELQADGHEAVIGPVAFAQPAGPTVASAYQALLDELLAGLQAAGPVDAVYLWLHGAMLVDGLGEGGVVASAEPDILRQVRARVGERYPSACCSICIAIWMRLCCSWLTSSSPTRNTRTPTRWSGRGKRWR